MHEPTEVQPAKYAAFFREADAAIRSIARVESGSNSRNMTLGWYGAHVKAADEWNKYGYADEAAYRDSIPGISVGTWGRYLRIAGFFLNLPLPEFSKLSAENADLLSKLPEVDREDPEWLRKAQTLKAEDFRRDVISRRAHLAGVQVPEMRVTYKQKCFEAQRKVITEGVEEFRRDNGIIDDGTALEWIVMEASQRRTFSKFIGQQLPILRAALRPSSALRGNAEEALELHIIALADMLQNLKTEKQ